VPAFADSLVAPTPITVTSPALTGGALSIDAAKELVFVWTGASAGRIAFNVRQFHAAFCAQRLLPRFREV
jgi:hypothetical protein